jgi:oligosaccharide repeat unit polymerase
MNNDLASPAVMFMGPFCVALICAAVYSDRWQLNLHFNTFFVLLLGCFEFVLVCITLHKTIGIKLRRRTQINVINKKNELTAIYVNNWKTICVIIIQLISIKVVYLSLSDSLGQYGINGKLNVLMYYYREYKYFSDYEVGISSLATNLRNFSIAVTYVWIYIILNNFLSKKKNYPYLLMLVSIVLGIVNSVMLGARGEAIQIIVAAIVVYLFLLKRKNGWKPQLKIKQIFYAFAILLIIMFTFKASGNLLGRNAVIKYSTSVVDEVAKYLGGEIKNLDIYLQEPFKNNQIAGSQTFGVILGWLDNKLNLNWNIEIDLPFQKVNGISLGNVYTVFYSYIYDYGYAGMIILTMLFAIIVQLIYEYAHVDKKNDKISFRVILNSYVLSLVVFSFFGERFFSAIVNFTFIKYIIVWLIMIWFLPKDVTKYTNNNEQKIIEKLSCE